MKKLLTATAIVIALGTATPVMAQGHGFDKAKYEQFKKMSPEERKAHFEKKKADWQKLTKEEKLKVIETKRAERIKAMDEHWKSLSDDDKIKFVEKRMERGEKRFDKKGFGEHKKGDYKKD